MQTDNLTTEKTFAWLNENSRKFLAAGYLGEGITAEERIANIAKRAEEILQMPGYAEKFYHYMSQGYYSLASPVWSNFGKERGLPISCFGSHIDDDIGNILYSQSEVGMMSKLGGGTSGYFGKIRHRGAEIKDNGQASGAVHLMKLFESMVDVVSQGSVRRGRFSPYLPIDHPDIMEFLEIGTEGNPIQELTHGVTVTNDWMQEIMTKGLFGLRYCKAVEKWVIHIFSSLTTQTITQQMCTKTKSCQSMQVIYVQKLCCHQITDGLLFVFYQASMYCITISGRIRMLLKQ